MALNQNQFAQTPVQGEVDLQGFGSNVISASVDLNQVVPLVPGQAVKLATTAGGVPKVLACAANSDSVFGFVTYNLKDASYPAGARLEIALFGTVLFMTSGAAITRGASIEIVVSSNKVITNAGTNPVTGFAYDSFAADGDLGRVYVQAPFGAVNAALNNSVKSLQVVSTLAEINAGKVLIPAVTGQKITLLNYTGRVVGGFATGTAVVLESTNGTPVVASTVAEAGLTNGAILTPTESHTTLGAGFATPLGTSDGLQVVNSGSAQTGGTSITWTLTYIQQ